jgi:hypothetical protein
MGRGITGADRSDIGHESEMDSIVRLQLDIPGPGLNQPLLTGLSVG